MPNLAVAHNVATAISYDRLVKDRLQQTARRRGKNFDFPAFLKKENQEFNRRAVDENAIEPRSQPPKDAIRKGRALMGDWEKGATSPHLKMAHLIPVPNGSTPRPHLANRRNRRTPTKAKEGGTDDIK